MVKEGYVLIFWLQKNINFVGPLFYMSLACNLINLIIFARYFNRNTYNYFNHNILL